MTPGSRIEARFAALEAEGRAGLVTFLTAGDPDPETSARILQGLPAARVATPAEVLTLIEKHHLMGRGIGFVDAQLLASARLTHCTLWTQDRRLAELAAALGVRSQNGGARFAPLSCVQSFSLPGK